ncbi:UDP-N-acetylhexosamine pyrophosphorylase [Homalodisca vitripennis]|uniref:UDP-N-acetylhexosamine pyrophosphorylase n=1 Tax=Homalodisca vitripennis TaxID=197043 RepID=UPI001EEB9248|nr:UDP-N-acetylhexosamine pyrophosphorylase [Homalodisca vitripennis]KAG8322854.1 UDP-N-acetylglucosamine pyrophosphorylase [Homalodisca vitripennis]
MSDINEIKGVLSELDQEHLLQFWDRLSQSDKDELLSDIKEINLKEVISYFKRTADTLNENQEKLDDRMKPIPSHLYGAVSRTSPEHLQSFQTEGYVQISEGRVGVLLMAGGQGTRLGSSLPKGMYNIGLPSNKSLYQIQAERILKLQQLAFSHTGKQGSITWIIMTSEKTMEPTKEYFEENNYFGLSKTNVIFFEQGQLPCFTFDGKIILERPNKISKSPDGNGGIYRALRDKKVLDEIEKRGVEYLHCHSVDNILVRVADPVFVGYCVKRGADCGAKVVPKAFPTEALGVICNVDDKFQVVEYSEITLKTAEMRNNDGKLTFSAGSICNHFFTAKFLRKIIGKYENQLKIHVAKKKIPFVNENGVQCVPEKPNGIKMEKFVFDVFPFAENLVVWEVNREDEFSALKNSDSSEKDNPSTAKRDLFSQHARFIRQAGGEIIGNPLVCEISPLLSYAGEGLKSVVEGKTFQSPLLLKSSKEEITNGSNGIHT